MTTLRRPLSRLQPRRLAPILLGGGLLLAGCGGGGDTSPPTAPAPAPAPSLDLPFSIEELEVGDGAVAVEGWLVAIGWSGWLYDPNVADHRGEPIGDAPTDDPTSFRIGSGQVIPGVDQGVSGMAVGGRRSVVVPPDMAFGAAGTNTIPGNATLLYEFELVAAGEVPFSATDLVEGDGPVAEAGQALSVAYRGWIYDLLADGNRGDLFDSTTAEDPFQFTLGVGAVIEGWDQGVPGMRVGGMRRLVLPHDLAYGTTGNSRIPAYSTLLFEVELLAIE